MATTQQNPVTTPPLGRYAIDTSRSRITFGTRHLFGLMPVRGTFAIRRGTIDVAEPLGTSTIYAEIDTASFRTDSAVRDAAVRSPRFLDADGHPVMTFACDQVGDAAVEGTLTVRGVARPVHLAIEESSITPRSFAVTASTRIDRTEFGVTASPGLAGRYLDIRLEVHCARA
jgi:polyisoprenoid-binding protein YceI